MGNCDQYPSCGPASQSAPAEPHWTLPGWPHGIPAALFLSHTRGDAGGPLGQDSVHMQHSLGIMCGLQSLPH